MPLHQWSKGGEKSPHVLMAVITIPASVIQVKNIKNTPTSVIDKKILCQWSVGVINALFP